MMHIDTPLDGNRPPPEPVVLFVTEIVTALQHYTLAEVEALFVREIQEQAAAAGHKENP